MAGDQERTALETYLAACVRETLAQQDWPAWPFGPCNEAEFEQLGELCEFHGIGLLLARYRKGFVDWPRPAVEAIQALAHRAAFEEALRRPSIARLIERLAERGIAHRLLKGSAISYLYYAEPADRPCGDTDIVILPHDLAITREVLTASGWSRQGASHFFPNQENWTIDCGAGMVHTLDLHWRMSNRAVLRKLLPIELFWATSCPLPRLSQSATGPDPVLLLLHGAVNQLWHEHRGFYLRNDLVLGRRRLIWGVDQALICGSFDADDWDRLIAICHKHGAAPIVHAALASAVEDVGLSLPDGVLARLQPKTSVSAELAYICTTDARSEFLTDLAASENLSLRARLVWSTVFASRSHLVGKYPRASNWPTAALQARRYWGIIKDLAGSGPGKAVVNGKREPIERNRG